MKPAAHFQTIVEFLDQYDPYKKPLAEAIKLFLKTRRYAGSKDRRQITNHIYAVIRESTLLLEILGLDDWQPNQGRFLLIAFLARQGTDLETLFSGDNYCPATLTSIEKDLEQKSMAHQASPAATAGFPAWLFDLIALQDQQALRETAPLDCRVNLSHLSRDAAQESFTQEGIECTAGSYATTCLRFENGRNLTAHPLYLKGSLDIQDESSQILSQLLVQLCADTSDSKILDLCAGAGGKTLAMAEALENQGNVYATDINPGRLKRAKRRAKERNLTNIIFLDYEDLFAQKSYQEFFDLVLIDAPCSGTGTLRRHPELPLWLTLEKVNDYKKIQVELLDKAPSFLPSKGLLVYATCSVLERENTDQIDSFIRSHPDFSVVNAQKICDKVLECTPKGTQEFLHLTPGRTKTDGFFAAILEKNT